MKFVNFENFNKCEIESEPFDYVIIDNFLNDDCIEEFLFELNKFTPENSYYFGSKNYEFTKSAFKDNLGLFIESVFQELCSKEFVNILEKKFGIYNILINNTREGSGIHKVYNNGFLTMHEDFNHVYNEKLGLLDRRINLLLYNIYIRQICVIH